MVKDMMFVKIAAIICAVSIGSLCAFELCAEPPKKDERLVAWYGAYWSGLHVGDMVIEVAEDDNRYHFESVVESKGLAWLISRFYSMTKSEGIVRKGTYNPQEFRIHTVLREKPRDITLTYDPQGNIPARHYHPPENRHKRPDVPEAKRNGVIDPLTMALQARAQIENRLAKGEQEFTMRFYDGRRLQDVHFQLRQPETMRYAGQEMRVIPLQMTREPLAGFTGQEKERMAEGVDPVFDLWLSPAHDWLPLKIRGTAAKGTAVGYLKKICREWQHCATAADVKQTAKNL